MRDAYEDLKTIAQLRLRICQLNKGQEDPEVRRAIDDASQAVGQLTALLYSRVFTEQPESVVAPSAADLAPAMRDLPMPRTAS